MPKISIFIFLLELQIGAEAPLVLFTSDLPAISQTGFENLVTSISDLEHGDGFNGAGSTLNV